MDGRTESYASKKYAPDILGEIKDVFDEIEERGDLLPKSELQEAITYLRNEWNAVVDIFNYGDTYLDNNMVERMNRYISLSRKNSLFFGSHKGAERGAILYTIALTCRMHKVNLFEYLTDVINRTAEWQPNTPIENTGNCFLTDGKRLMDKKGALAFLF